jgi:hypothetical protein
MSLARDLAALRSNARLRGRTISRNQIAGAVEGRARSASARATSARQAKTAQEGLAIQREGIASREKIAGQEMSLRERLASDEALLRKELQSQDIRSRESLQDKSIESSRRNLDRQLMAQEIAQQRSLHQSNVQFGRQMQYDRQRDKLRYDAEMKNYEISKERWERRFEEQKKQSRRCIIITACTSPTSYEVELARVFRDQWLDSLTLGGYYALCEIVVPFIDKYESIRKLAKKYLVDSFTDFAEYFYFKKTGFDKKRSKPITLGFLKLCQTIGRFVDTKKWIDLHR